MSDRSRPLPSLGLSIIKGMVKDWLRDVWQAWDRFWFSPSDPATLGLIRILAGAMLLYTHFVWLLDLDGFFGANGWLSKDFVYRYHDSAFAWSHLYWIESPTLLWGDPFVLASRIRLFDGGLPQSHCSCVCRLLHRLLRTSSEWCFVWTRSD